VHPVGFTIEISNLNLNQFPAKLRHSYRFALLREMSCPYRCC